MRALVADDEEPARRRLIRQLQTLGGVEVVGEAADGLERLARMWSLQPEVLFLDVRMPALDGIAVASHEVALMPIVFTTRSRRSTFRLELVPVLVTGCTFGTGRHRRAEDCSPTYPSSVWLVSTR